MKLSNIHKPTSAFWSKFAASCVAVSTFIAGYGLTSGNAIVGYIGLGIGCLGTIIAILSKP